MRVSVLAVISMFWLSGAIAANRNQVKPVEIPEWDGNTDVGYVFGKTEGSPIYGRLFIDAGPAELGFGAGFIIIGIDRRSEAQGWVKGADGEKHWEWPKVTIKVFRVWINGKLYLEDHNPDPRSTNYGTKIPYPSERIRVQFELNTGRKVGMILKIKPGIPGIDVKHDSRKYPSSETPYLDHVWAHFVYPQIFVRACLSKPKNGKVKWMKVVLLKHPFLSPKGDLVIGETFVYIPVYELAIRGDKFWYDTRPPELLHYDVPFKITAECETTKGIHFKTTFEYVLKRQQHQQGDD